MDERDHSIDLEELRWLTERFRQAGASDPELWAQSQLEEGIPQLARFSFLKSLWTAVVAEDDDSWIDQEIAAAKMRPGRPCTAVGPALEEMLAKGVSREGITDFVRGMQYATLYDVCLFLDGARQVDVPVQKWTLYEVDDDGEPVAIIQGLNGSILTLDPTGREMRPRPTR